MECLLSRLTEAGYTRVPFGEPADWTIVDTCTVTAAADADSRSLLRRAVRASTGGRVVATGCLVQRDPRVAAGIEGVDWVVGNAEKPSLARWILGADPESERRTPGRPRILVGADPTLTRFAAYGSSSEGRRTRATLKVQDGCDERCTFCVIPRVRGRSRSRPIEEVLSEARTLVASGYTEIALTGINTALWGRDLEPRSDLPHLLAALESVAGLERIRLNSLEPQHVRDGWLDQVAESAKLCRHLHLPLQSGSDEILKRMNRRYRVGDYARVVEGAARRMPDAAIGCDLLVGFPGETARHFEEGLRFLRSLPLAYLHVFSYSPRPDTPSPRLDGAVEVEERKRRSAAARELGRRFRQEFTRRQLGTAQTVIPESRSTDGWGQGLTGNYLRARFRWAGPGGASRKPLLVRLVEIEDDGCVRAERIGAVEGSPA
jgi:threonylcarbamoyladenosine tRNA methylthiotransferase MtaB